MMRLSHATWLTPGNDGPSSSPRPNAADRVESESPDGRASGTPSPAGRRLRPRGAAEPVRAVAAHHTPSASRAPGRLHPSWRPGSCAPGDPAQQTPDDHTVPARADHESAVDPAGDAGELCPGLGANSAAGGIGRLEVEHQRIAREPVLSAQRQTPWGIDLCHRKPRQRVAGCRSPAPIAERARRRDSEESRQRRGGASAEVRAQHRDQGAPHLLACRGDLDGILIDVGQVLYIEGPY